MAVGNSLEVFGGLFIKYMPGFISFLNRESLLRKLPLGKVKWEGQKLVKKINTQWNTSIHNTVDGGSIQPAVPVLFVEAECYRKFTTASAAITDGLMAAASSSKQSAVKSTEFILKNTLDVAKRYENFMLSRDGTGVVGLLGATVSGAFITVTDARGMHPGAQYEIRDAADPTTIHASFKVKYVQRALTSGEAVVYLDQTLGAVGQAAGDYISWGVGEYSSYGRAVNGLDLLIDDAAVSSFQGVNTTLYPYYTSPVIDGGGAQFNITPDILRQMQALLKQESEGFKVPGGLLIYTSAWDSVNVEAMYENALRITPDSKSVGFAGGLTFKSAMGTFTILSDHDIPYGKMFFIDRTKISRPIQQEMHWRRYGGGEIFTPSSNKLGYVATMVEIGDLFIEERHTSGKIENMRVTPGSAY